MALIDKSKLPKGIDVSSHQPNIDWPKVAAAGYSFAFIKATEGTDYTNPHFARDRAEAKAAGVLVSAYHYFRPSTDPIAQAKHFCSVVGAIPTGELQPAFDLEETDNVPASTIIHQSVQWLMEVQNTTGRAPIIYTYPDFLKSKLGNTRRFCKDWALWMASYGTPAPPLLGGWDHVTFWQFTDQGHVPGIAPIVDLNYFMGNMDQLKKFAGL